MRFVDNLYLDTDKIIIGNTYNLIYMFSPSEKQLKFAQNPFDENIQKQDTNVDTNVDAIVNTENENEKAETDNVNEVQIERINVQNEEANLDKNHTEFSSQNVDRRKLKKQAKKLRKQKVKQKIEMLDEKEQENVVNADATGLEENDANVQNISSLLSKKEKSILPQDFFTSYEQIENLQITYNGNLIPYEFYDFGIIFPICLKDSQNRIVFKTTDKKKRFTLNAISKPEVLEKLEITHNYLQPQKTILSGIGESFMGAINSVIKIYNRITGQTKNILEEL